MKLRDVAHEIVIDSRKLTEYVLNPDNPKGVDKALMFKRHLGFTKENCNYPGKRKEVEN